MYGFLRQMAYPNIGETTDLRLTPLPIKYPYTPSPRGVDTIMDEKTRKAVTQRLASAAGHIKGIERMAQEDAYCIDMIRQIQAVQAALNKVTAMMLDTHLHTCMMTAVRGQDMAERERMLVEVTAVFEMSNKY